MPVPYQPIPSMDEKHSPPNHQLPQSGECHNACGGGGHEECRNSFRRTIVRQVALAAALSFMVTLVLFFGSCMNDMGSGSLDDIMKRATDSSGANNGSFVHNKLYLIIVFVGLFIVFILAIMLSAWCCRGSFNNPLCCPCYTCALCGGLACLDCIACGLCAEGLDQV